MANNIANILVRLRGESQDADDTVDGFIGKLRQFGAQRATAKADIELSGLEKLAAAEASLKAFSNAQASAKVDLDISKALAKRDELKAVISSLDAQSIVPPEVTRRGEQLSANIDKVRTSLDELKQSDPGTTVANQLKKLDAQVKVSENNLAKLSRTPVPSSPEQAGTRALKIKLDRASLEVLRGQLRELTTKSPELIIKARIDQAEANLARLVAELAAVPNEKTIRMKLELEAAKAEADLVLLDASLAVLTAKKRKIEIKTDIDSNPLRAVGTALRDAEGLGKKAGVALSGLGQGLSGITGALKGVTTNIGPFGAKLGAAILALIPVVYSLITALTAMIVLLAGAAVAVAGLATAFVAALGPAVALAYAVFKKISSILKIVKAQKDANAAADRKSVEGTKAAAAAEQARRDSLKTVKDALQSVTDNQRNLTTAKASAAQAIQDAAKQEQQAARQLVDANAQVKQSTVDAYAAVRQSVIDAAQAFTAFQSAKLSVEESKVATQEAELALQNLRKESGLAGKAYNDLFKKASDIHSNVDVSGLASKFTQGGTSKSTALDLEKGVLALRRAKLSEKQATESLGNSERDLTTKRQVAARYQREGIAAYKPLTDAIRAQRDASATLSDATAKYTQLQRQGISQAPAVIAASEALRRSQEGLAAARLKNRELLRTQASGKSDAQQKANDAFGKLTPAEQAFGRTLNNLRSGLRGFFNPAVDSVLNGITRIINRLPILGVLLKKPFENLGKIAGNTIGSFADALVNPRILSGLISIVNASGELVKTLGGPVFKSFANIFLNVAVALLPAMNAGLRKFGAYLTSLSSSSNNQAGIVAVFRDTFLPVLSTVFNIVKALVSIFGALFTATVGPSKTLGNNLVEALNSFKNFLQSASGQNKIRKFFQDVLPLVGEVIKAVIQVAVFIGYLVQVAAPALTGIVALFNVLAGIVNTVVGALVPFLQILFTIALAIFGPASIGSAILRVLIRFGALLGIAGIFGKMRTIIRTFTHFLRVVFHGLVATLLYPFKKFFSLVGGIINDFFNLGKRIVKALIKGIKALAGGILGTIKDAVSGDVNVFGVNINPFAQDKPKPPARPRAAPTLVGIFPPGVIPTARTPRSVGRVSTASTGGGRGGVTIENQQVIVPAAAGHDQLGDPKEQAARFAREMQRRGRG